MIYRENNNGWDRRQCWDEEVRMQSSFYEDEHGARVAWYGYDGNVTQERRTCVVPGNGNTLAFFHT